eukprot:Rmarinus@m.872
MFTNASIVMGVLIQKLHGILWKPYADWTFLEECSKHLTIPSITQLLLRIIPDLREADLRERASHYATFLQRQTLCRETRLTVAALSEPIGSTVRRDGEACFMPSASTTCVDVSVEVSPLPIDVAEDSNPKRVHRWPVPALRDIGDRILSPPVELSSSYPDGLFAISVDISRTGLFTAVLYGEDFLWGNVLSIWDAHDVLVRIILLRDYVSVVHFGNDETVLVCKLADQPGSGPGPCLVNVLSGQRVRCLPFETTAVSPDVATLALCWRQSHQIVVRSVWSDLPICTLDNREHAVLSLCFHPCTPSLISLCNSGSIKVWSLASKGSCLAILRPAVPLTPEHVHGFLNVTSDGTQVVSVLCRSEQPSVVFVWSLVTYECVWASNPPLTVVSAQFWPPSSKCNLLLVAAEPNDLYRCDIHTGRIDWCLNGVGFVFDYFPIYETGIIRYNSSRQRVLCAGSPVVRVWECADGVDVDPLPFRSSSLSLHLPQPEFSPKLLCESLSTSPEGSKFALSTTEGLFLGCGRTGTILNRVSGRLSTEGALLAFNPSGSLLSYVDGQDVICVWDATLKRLIMEQQLPKDFDIRALFFASDLTVVAFNGQNELVSINLNDMSIRESHLSQASRLLCLAGDYCVVEDSERHIFITGSNTRSSLPVPQLEARPTEVKLTQGASRVAACFRHSSSGMTLHVWDFTDLNCSDPAIYVLERPLVQKLKIDQHGELLAVEVVSDVSEPPHIEVWNIETRAQALVVQNSNLLNTFELCGRMLLGLTESGEMLAWPF